MPEHLPFQSFLTNGAGTISGTVNLRTYNSARKSIMIQNLGTAVLYVGGSGVIDSTGIKVDINQQIVLDHSEGAAVFCYSDGTCSIRFLEEIV